MTMGGDFLWFRVFRARIQSPLWFNHTLLVLDSLRTQLQVQSENSAYWGACSHATTLEGILAVARSRPGLLGTFSYNDIL